MKTKAWAILVIIALVMLAVTGTAIADKAGEAIPANSGLVLKWPFNGAETTDHTISFGWYNVEDAQKYLLQVDNDADFSSPEIETYVVESQFTPVVPLLGDTYYWRVKTIYKESESMWSDTAEFATFSIPLTAEGIIADLGIVAQQQHKDTRMLCLEGCPLTGAHAWDVDHVTRGCAHDDHYCARARLSMVVSCYGGTLSQDRISYNMFKDIDPDGAGPISATDPEGDLGHGIDSTLGQSRDAYTWAFNGASIDYIYAKPSFNEIRGWIDANRPVGSGIPGHAVVIDGYDTTGELVHVIDPWTGTESSIAWATFPFTWAQIPPAGATVRSDEASLTQDSDNDGIVDFDEINRFNTDPNKANSDCDFVPDKAEVRCYTFLSDDSFDLADVRKPDPDGDGLRAELDRDSDNGGVIDGAEDLNRNGKVELGETDPLDDADDSPNTESTILNGLSWLCTNQNPDGSWTGSAGKNVGYTSLAVLAFLNYGIDESDPTVSKGINYILSKKHADGSIYTGWSNYETSLALLPLVATHNSSYDDEIVAARNFLVNIQNDEGEGLTNSDWTYGGWGYAGSSPGWSDLSNTQWSLMGLDAAGLSKTSNTWSKGELYVTRCQNLQATNPEYDVTNDGGFTYQPPNISCCWGYNGNPKHSYGAITAAGVWSLRLADVNTADQRVQAGLNWLRNNYAPIDTVQNPGIGNTYLYYYLLSFAKALIMTGIPAGGWQETASNDITNYIVSQQYADGHWTSNEGALFATEQAILALQTRTIPTNIQRLSYLTFILCSNADLHVYDPLGRHVGKNYDTGGIDLEIPNATYTSNGVQNITIPGLETGNYRIVLIGTGTGEYTLNVTGGVGNDTVSEDSYTGNITEGEVHDAEVNVAMITWLTIHVEEPDEMDTMVQAATGTGPVYFIVEASEIEDLVALNESDMPEDNPIVEFPHGLFGFNITGLTPGQNVTLIITFPSAIPTTSQYWKYNTSSGEWYQIPMGSNDGDNIITIALQDGGIGDDDGVANGVIVDQGGPGIPTGVARVPTLTPIGIIALVGLLTIVAVGRIRKKK